MALSKLFNDSFFRSPSIFSNEFHSLFNDLDRISAATPFTDSSLAASFAPRVKLVEHGNEYKIEAEVAGFPKEALTIDFPDARVLRLSGKFEQENNHNPKSADFAPEAVAARTSPAAQSSSCSTEVTTTAADHEKQLGSKNGRIWHNERISRSFTRNIGLPGAIDTDAVKASLENGVLSIVLPKLEKATSTKRVQIVDAKV